MISPATFTAQKMKFSVKGFLISCAVITIKGR